LQIILAVKSIEKIDLHPIDFKTYIKLEKLLKLPLKEKIQLQQSKNMKFIGFFKTGTPQEKHPFYIAFCKLHQIYYLSDQNHPNCPICMEKTEGKNGGF